jgi:ATP-dependent helicase/nuclease subunit A
MTQSQKVASNPSHSVYVAASAGSGKTKVLTDRVLRILLSGTPPGKIMCLTFTNAAAAEMANRINKNLMKWVVASDEELFQNISDLTSTPPDNKTMELARRLFVEVLDTPDGLKIQTIHAFCQNLMRRFPLEAGIAPHFTVIDEHTSLELLKEARMRLLSEGDRHSENVQKSITNIAWHLHEGSFTSLLQEITNEREKIEYLLSKYRSAEIITKIYETLGVSGQNEEEVVADAYAEPSVRSDLRSACIVLLESDKKGDIESGDLLNAFLDKYEANSLKPSPVGRGRGEGAESDPKKDNASLEPSRPLTLTLSPRERGQTEFLAAAFDTYKYAFLTQKDEPSAKVATVGVTRKNPLVEDILKREQARIIELLDKLKSIRIARLTEDLFHISEAVLALYKKAKNSKAFLDYNDLIIASNRLLHKPDIAPWILYKLDGGIDHLLVDEAQDTSPAQWQVIEALCEEFFTGDGAVDKNRTVFIVGDEKQSIFSFQGADPQVFHKMQEVFSARAQNAKKGWEAVSLDMSFRSTNPVLAAVDAIFSEGAIKSAITFKIDPIKHIAHRHNHAGRVELWPLIEKDDEESLAPWAMPIKRTQPNNSKKKMAEEICSKVKDWLDSGRKIEAQGRAVAPGDIMILVRRRDALVDYLVRGLKARGVAVAGVDRMVLTNHIAVMDLIALGNFLLLPQDDLTLATVLKTPLIGMSEDELFELAHGRGEMSLWEALRAENHEINARGANSLKPSPVGRGRGEGAESDPKEQGLSFEQPSRPLTLTLSPRERGQSESLVTAYKYLSNLLNKTDFLSPFGLYSYILEAQGGRKKFASRLGMEVNDPIDEFLSLALSYEKTHPPALQGFLHWLAIGDSEVKRELDQGNNEVRIMTVHASKGLQAPIVILPDTTSMPKSDSGSILWGECENDPVMLWTPRVSNMNKLCSDLRDAEKKVQNQEYLRLLYVALTRAEDELYIAGYEGKKSLPKDCWYNVVKSGMGRIAQKNGDILYIESQQEVVVSNNNATQTAADEVVTLPEFINAIPPVEPSPSIPLAPSQMTEDNPPVRSPLFGKSVLRGKLIHKLLEYLPDIDVSERETVAMRFLSKYNKELSNKERAEILESVFKVLNDELMSHIFGKGSKAEVPIAGVVGKYVISGQIDRLLVSEDEVWVVDYKTNRTPPVNAENVHINYLKQMAAYKAALKHIYPDKSIRCSLVWTEAPEVMLLENELLDRFFIGI